MIDNFYRGDTKSYSVEFVDGDGGAISIEGGSLWFTLKSDKADSYANAALRVVVTGHTDAVEGKGKTTITLSKSDTNITPGKYYYDCQFVNSAHEVTTLFEGEVRVLEDVTDEWAVNSFDAALFLLELEATSV